MNKNQLKQLVRQIVKEAIGLGVAETNLQEGTPPDFPAALKKKLLSRYKDVPQKAYATMWKMHNSKNEGNQRVCEMWAAWESKGMNEAVSGMNVAYIVNVDNNVCSLTGDEIAEIVKKHGVKMQWIGDAAFGTETLRNYKFKISGPTGEIDTLVDELAEENGIKFQDSKLKERDEKHDEKNMNNPEEKREVELAKKTKAAAAEILKMHGK
jgi:hypothetical protein